ncbi:MAG: TonB-dependent receptor [Carboxylicivirga sp.]|jgi:TonB-linked SusC/RagA family outer membrane protein|nr:TonB-dependent receptor [Carboxylicivirga sp.]
MKRNIFLLLTLLFCSVAWAQTKSISGTITDISGDPLPGVNVVEKGTMNGTITNLDGFYKLNLSGSSETLVYSFIGFATQEIVVGNQTQINVTLLEDAIGLDEVVAVGYGVQKKSDLTGSVEVVEAESLTKQAVFQTSQALQGAAPGLTVIQSSGQPGSDKAQLRIRGIGSINASSNPLVLIDGIEGDIDGVDAGDIENVTVLKDAGAAAIYGSRASNGVILVTTKRGESGKVTANYNGYMGFQTPTNVPEFLGAMDYLELVGDDALLEEYKNNPNDLDNYPDVNWADSMFSEDGAMQYHSISVSGGSDFAKVNASLSYQDQDGNIPNYGFKRYQGRINSDFTITSWMNLALDVNYRNDNQTSPRSGTQLRDAYRQLPIYAQRYSNGNWANPPTGGNSLAFVELGGVNDDVKDNFRARMHLELEPVKNLKVGITYSPEKYDRVLTQWSPQFELYSSPDDASPTVKSFGTNNEATLRKYYYQSRTDNFVGTLNYTKEIGSHKFVGLAGYESIYWKSDYFEASRYGYDVDNNTLNSGNPANATNKGSENHYGLVSYFGRLNYEYANRYLFTFNIRRDGSSRFAEDHRWGVFPSFSAGWNLHNESFFPQNDILTRIKLRGSWGQLGNQILLDDDGNQIYFPYTSTITTGSSYYADGTIQQGATQGTLANEFITWEKSETMNIGFDFGLFGNALSGAIEYYDRRTKDLLGTQRIPYTTGLNAPIANVYSMKNTGVDLSLMYKGSLGKLKYSVDGNFATLSNEVTDLNGVDFIIDGSSINKMGEAVNSIYGYKTIGIFETQEEIDNAPTQFGDLQVGDLRFADVNGRDENGELTGKPDGVVDSDDRVILGNSFPSISYGININLDYNNFDFSASFVGIGGREIYLREYLVWPLYNGGNAAQWMVDEAWTEDNKDARYPAIRLGTSSNNNRASSTYVYNASYFRLRNLTIGYTLPKDIMSRVNISNLRIYVSGQNLLTFDNMPQGIDPTVPNSSNGGNYPLVKSYTFGISASF